MASGVDAVADDGRLGVPHGFSGRADPPESRFTNGVPPVAHGPYCVGCGECKSCYYASTPLWREPCWDTDWEGGYWKTSHSW